MGYVYDAATDRSELAIIDGQTLEDGPPKTAAPGSGWVPRQLGAEQIGAGPLAGHAEEYQYSALEFGSISVVDADALSPGPTDGADLSINDLAGPVRPFGIVRLQGDSQQRYVGRGSGQGQTVTESVASKRSSWTMRTAEAPAYPPAAAVQSSPRLIGRRNVAVQARDRIDEGLIVPRRYCWWRRGVTDDGLGRELGGPVSGTRNSGRSPCSPGRVGGHLLPTSGSVGRCYM